MLSGRTIGEGSARQVEIDVFRNAEGGNGSLCDHTRINGPGGESFRAGAVMARPRLCTLGLTRFTLAAGKLGNWGARVERPGRIDAASARPTGIWVRNTFP